MPTAELCASPTNISTTSSILKLGTPTWQSTVFTGAWLNLSILDFHWTVLTDSWLNYLPSSVDCLLSASSELVRETGSELSLQLWKDKSEFSALFFATSYWAAKCGQPFVQTNRGKLIMQWEIDVGSELPLISCDVTHRGLACSNNQLHTPSLDRLGERDCLRPLIKMYSVIHTWTSMRLVTAWGLSSCMCGYHYHIKKKHVFSAYLRPR